MRHTRDTFLHFLDDNLVEIPIHNIRKEKDNETQADLMTNALNVQFLNSDFASISNQTVALDIIHDDELTAIDWANNVFLLLKEAGYTPKLDYTDPQSPADTGKIVSWEPTVKFRPVETGGSMFRLTALLQLKHQL